MASGTKSFVFNRQQDWEDGGLLENFVFMQDQLCSASEQAWFFSEALDSMQTETCWHRLRMDAQIPQNTLLEVYVMAVDATAEERNAIDSRLRDAEIANAQKLQMFETYGKKIVNVLDVPLFALNGQYLWFGIHIAAHTDAPIVIDAVKLEFPRIAFIDYLPQIYRKQGKNSFLSRYLMIFQSIYVDFEEKLEQTPRLFDVTTAPPAFLEWLTKWFSIEDSAQWSEEKLRKLLQNAAEIYQKKGTCDSIRQIVWHYLEEFPYLIEQFDAVQKETAPEKQTLIRQLYGDTGYTFTVLVPSECVPDSDTYMELQRLIGRCQPIDAICNLVVLPKAMYLDCHCYLGINTRLPYQEQLQVGNENAPLLYLS